jgi:hypothetical protein
VCDRNCSLDRIHHASAKGDYIDMRPDGRFPGGASKSERDCRLNTTAPLNG